MPDEFDRQALETWRRMYGVSGRNAPTDDILKPLADALRKARKDACRDAIEATQASFVLTVKMRDHRKAQGYDDGFTHQLENEARIGENIVEEIRALMGEAKQ